MKHIIIQEYIVQFDIHSKIDIYVTIYHETPIILTNQEIIDEAFCYLEESGIKADERNIVEIRSIEKRNNYEIGDEKI